MNYTGVSELKQTKRMWKMLDSEGELVLTKEGKPGAVILAVTPETLESTVRSIRRALAAQSPKIFGRLRPHHEFHSLVHFGLGFPRHPF